MKMPFTPAVYEHAARFVGRTPWEVSRDPELLFTAHCAAYRAYQQETLAVGIDIYNLEAEAYGAHVEKPDGNGIPAIDQPLLNSIEQGLSIPAFDPNRDGRIPMAIAVGQRLKRELPEANVRIPVAGPFSIAFNLRGITPLCEDAALEPELTAKLLMRLAENQASLCCAVAKAGLDVAFFESAAAPPMLSPRQFHDVELPALKRILDIAANCVGHPVPCIMGGNTYPVVDDLLSTGTGFLICNVETDQTAFAQTVYKKQPVAKVRINMNPAVVTCSNPERIYGELDRILSFAAGLPNCLIGTGALPFETPMENVALMREYLA